MCMRRRPYKASCLPVAESLQLLILAASQVTTSNVALASWHGSQTRGLRGSLRSSGEGGRGGGGQVKTQRPVLGKTGGPHTVSKDPTHFGQSQH